MEMEQETINLIDLYRELKKIEQRMVTKEEFNMGVETLSVLSNRETMEQIEKSKEDIKRDRVKKISSVKDI